MQALRSKLNFANDVAMAREIITLHMALPKRMVCNGDIVTLMHKYYTGGGSYDHYFVLDNNGKELLDLGESLDESKLK